MPRMAGYAGPGCLITRDVELRNPAYTCSAVVAPTRLVPEVCSPGRPGKQKRVACELGQWVWGGGAGDYMGWFRPNPGWFDLGKS